MYTVLSLAAFAASVLQIADISAKPVNLASSLAARDNQWNLKCSNAPEVTAGDFLEPSKVPEVQHILPDSGSDQTWMRLLWCTPGTRTYIFFNLPLMEPPPIQYRNIGGALHQAANEISTYLVSQKDGAIPNGSWTTSPPGTNTKIAVKNKGGEMTYGVLGSAMLGLSQFMDKGYNQKDVPIVFQINDGDWGEMGIGYVGMVDPVTGSCRYGAYHGRKWDCEDVMKGWVID